MRDALRKYRGLILLIFLLLLPILFLYSSARGRESSGKLTQLVQRVTGPLQSAVSALWGTVGGNFDRYFWLVGVAEENRQRAPQEHVARSTADSHTVAHTTAAEAVARTAEESVNTAGMDEAEVDISC